MNWLIVAIVIYGINYLQRMHMHLERLIRNRRAEVYKMQIVAAYESGQIPFSERADDGK